jgi:hypothetical protein
MLISSAIGNKFKPQLGQTKNYRICICYFSTKHI